MSNASVNNEDITVTLVSLEDKNVTVQFNDITNEVSVESSIFGDKGDKGDDGREVELSTNATYVLWRYVGDTVWNNLIALSELKGEKGDQGEAGTNGTNGADGTDGKEIELQKGSTYIQWRYVGTSTWTDLISIADLKGDAGRGISYISKLGSAGLVDTYHIVYTDGTTSQYNVTNGKDGIDGTTIKVNNISAVDGNITLTKSDLGLSNVDNTSDIDKPISTATQTALNAKEDLLPATPSDPDHKFLNGNKQWAEMAIGGGGYAAPVYFTTLDSAVSGYKQISYTNQVAETELTGVVSNQELLFRTYLFDADITTASIDAGVWNATYQAKVSNAAGVTQLKLEPFLRHANGTETVLFSTYGEEINNTTYALQNTQSVQPSFTCLPTDRLGVRLYGKTTSNASITISTIVGDGRAAYLTIPLKLRHNQLRDWNGDANYQHVTSAEKTAITHTNRSALDLVSGTNTGDETDVTIKAKIGSSTYAPYSVVSSKVPYTGATEVLDLGANTLNFTSSHSAVINKGLSAWSNKTILSTGYSASAGDYTKIGVASSGANTAGLYFTGAGRLGINSDIPLAQLEVRGTGGNSFDTTGIFFVTEATDINRRLKIGYSISNECAWIDAVKAGTDMVPLALCPRGGTSRVVIGGYAPNANAVLDVQSTTKAFMPPRMTTTQRDAIPSPTAGMVVYNTTNNTVDTYNGTAWSTLGGTEQAWQTPTLTNSWANFGGSFETAGYMKDSNGFVHIKGLIKTGTLGQAAITLPVGFRPSADLFCATVSNDTIGSVLIQTTGAVIPNTGSNLWFSINCSFRVQ